MQTKKLLVSLKFRFYLQVTAVRPAENTQKLYGVAGPAVPHHHRLLHALHAGQSPGGGTRPSSSLAAVDTRDLKENES